MNQHDIRSASLALFLGSAIGLSSCESAPGTKRQQGAAVGGVAGAVVGHQVGDGALGALIGGAIGAGGGWLAGGELEKLDEREADDAREAIEAAQSDPATVADVREASTADLNGNGFVTLDEIIALSEAGLNSDEVLQRLEGTGQVFELTDDQKNHLVANGVPREVTEGMHQLNREQRERAGLATGEDVVGRQPGGTD